MHDSRIVEADSVADYLQRYYKPDRLNETSTMPQTLLDSYTNQYARLGYVSTSHHDNITGAFIHWPTFPRSLLASRPKMCARMLAQAGVDSYIAPVPDPNYIDATEPRVTAESIAAAFNAS